MRLPPSVPENLARTIIGMHGAAGVEWLQSLPALVAGCERRWGVGVYPPFPRLSFNWVAPAIRDNGAPVVLKLSFPEEKEFRTEAKALRIFAGRGICRLLELDLDRGAMLLERLEPGTGLAAIGDDEEATTAAAVVMENLRRPSPPEHAFPLVADWARGFERLRARFDGGTGPMSADLVGRAESLFAELLASQGDLYLLHGDLHQENILRSGREPWLAIDPKGVVGEAAYETAALLHNPVEALDVPQPRKLLARRLDVLAERLGFDRGRIRAWGVAQAVLAAYWSLEDGGEPWSEALVFARLLGEIAD